MNEIKFVHVRFNKTNMPADNQKLKASNVLTGRDKRNANAKGGITIAYTLENDRVLASVAQCSDKDGYNKKIGAAIAKGRLSKSALVFPASAFKIENNKFYDVTNTLVDKILRLA